MKRIYLVITDHKPNGSSYITFEHLLDVNNYISILMDKSDTRSVEMRVISYVESEDQNESTTTNAQG